MTPDQVTVISAICTLTGIALIAALPPTLGTSALIVALLVLGYALDSADGQLARLRGGGTRRGEWLDHMFDALKIATIHLAVLVCWWRFYELDTAMLLFPIAFQVVANVMFFGFVLTDLIRRSSPSPEPASSPQYRLSPLYSLAVLPSDYGLLLLVFILLWLRPAFVIVYGLLTVANALLLGAAAFRWYRSLG
ncbi:CDP-alcohol phosphatidyltransferase family protein [Microbacterium sp. ARD32]|nr:CDP-alcohol phosphatidyltransferase family protein [Microbacterium sp. ARD32]